MSETKKKKARILVRHEWANGNTHFNLRIDSDEPMSAGEVLECILVQARVVLHEMDVDEAIHGPAPKGPSHG